MYFSGPSYIVGIISSRFTDEETGAERSNKEDVNERDCTVFNQAILHLTKGWSYYRKGTTVDLLIPVNKTHVHTSQDTSCILNHLTLNSSL